ncbi:hypothetical protein MATL_G00068240 [Megalops atlanticus]|uniref:Uncharacterized protein n=1 Tax=Megalops atlanticus TaxID=7932 RepID=A0A9D3QDS7_MEGAT|nr:hypothetical protein MATL_G00068240 [Megalops atlanticus]
MSGLCKEPQQIDPTANHAGEIHYVREICRMISEGPWAEITCDTYEYALHNVFGFPFDFTESATFHPGCLHRKATRTWLQRIPHHLVNHQGWRLQLGTS